VSDTHQGCKPVDDAFDDLYELEVVECLKCGFHLGLDATYLSHKSLMMPCPSCGEPLLIPEIE
jgi:predicted RNA-binding Zn-ribbon protein involved in translation (DUF1610 family)